MKKAYIVFSVLCITALILFLGSQIPMNKATEPVEQVTANSNTMTDMMKRDFDILYQNLKGIPSYSNSYGGGVSAVGENAFVVAVNPETTPIIAASRFGKGKVMAVGHPDYIKFSKKESLETKLTENIFIWLTDGQFPDSGKGKGMPVSYAEALAGKGTISLITNMDLSIDKNLPIDVNKVGSFTKNELTPNEHQLAFVNNFQKELTDDEVDALLKYIKKGGAVLFAEKGWVMSPFAASWMTDKNPNPQLYDYGIQKLLNEVGLSITTNIAADKQLIFPPLSYEQSDEYHFMNIISKAKQIEEGTLSPHKLNIGKPGVSSKKKLNIVGTIVSSTIGGMDPKQATMKQIAEEAENAEFKFPFNIGKFPYSSALLFYQVNQSSLAPDQAKLPSADVFPGKVNADAQIVENHAITVNYDFADLSHLNMLYPPGTWHSTGLYAPAGTNITIEVPEGTGNLDIQIGAHTDDLSHLSILERSPIVVNRNPLKAGTNEISSQYGGLIYLIPTQSSAGKQVDVKVSGAVNAPYFILGETTNEDWNQTIKNHSAPWAEFQGNTVILTVPSKVARTVENPEDLMSKWDDMVGQYNMLVGVSANGTGGHKGPDRQHRYVSDTQISAGYMHAGYPMMIPTHPAASEAVDFSSWSTLQGWGFWHELGHEYQQHDWTWPEITEVTVNLFSMYMQDYYGNPSRLLQKDSQGKDRYDVAFEFLDREDSNKEFSDIGVFERLVMFKQLQLEYDWDFYTNLFIGYRELPNDQQPTDEQGQKDLLVYMMSKTSGNNLLEFFGKWGWQITDHGRGKVEALNLPNLETEIWKLRENE